jgi:hypothetical protein
MVTIPERSFGIDSSRLLDELMHSTRRDETVAQQLHDLFGFIDGEEFRGARELLAAIEAKLGPNDPELTRAQYLMEFLEHAK